MAIDGKNSASKTLIAACALGLLVLALKSPLLFGDASSETTPPENTTNQSTLDPDKLLRISAVGDIMLGGTSEPVFEQFGYDYAFEQVKYLFEESDIVIGNLEGPLTHNEIPYSENKEYLFKTPPEKVAPALKNAGFTIMNLANNHIMDYGYAGVQDTLQALHRSGIQSVGAGDNLHQARQGTIISHNPYKIGFVSYSLTFPKEFWASTNSPGTAFGHEKQIREDVQRMSATSDIVVVSYHWGQEKSSELRDYQSILARAAIDAGAKLVIGHHPHVLQAVEQYRGGLILYSLGNFTFGSYSRNAESSVVAHINFHQGKFHSLQLIPIKVLNVEVNFQPHLLLGMEADRVISELNMLSRPQNTQLENRQGVAFLQASARNEKTVSSLH